MTGFTNQESTFALAPKPDLAMSEAASRVYIWVVVNMMVPFGVPIIVRHLLFRVPKKRP